MRHTRHAVVTLILLATTPAFAVDGDRQAPEDPAEKSRAVPLLVPNVQLHSWFTAWDQDESRVADAGGYGDPELDTGFNIRRARFGVNGGFKQVDFSLRFGSGSRYDTLSENPPAVDLVDAWFRASFETTAGTTRLSLGQQRVPLSREQQMSASDLPFQETAVSTAWLSPNRGIGFLASHEIAGFSLSAGVYNGGGDFRGNPDNGVSAVVRAEYALGGDTYRVNAGDSAFGIGAAYLYDHAVSTDTHMVEADLIARYKGLTLQLEGEMNILQPVEVPDVLPPDVPVVTRRLGGFAQLSYYRDVGIGAIEPAVRFAYLDDAEHLKDNGDVGILHAGVSWREPIPFLDLGAGYIGRFEFQGADALNDSVRVWAGVRYPSRHFRPVDVLDALRKLGARTTDDDATTPDRPRKKKPAAQ
jgi:hypothetical protein